MPRFTSETARENGIKGNLIRWSPKPSPEPPPEPEVIAAPVADAYHQRKLARVRAQWDTLDDMVDDETDPQKLDRLYAAMARVAEIERQLANRSLPPTLRANDKTRSNRRPGVQPIPQPVVSSVPQPSPVQPQCTPPVQPPATK